MSSSSTPGGSDIYRRIDSLDKVRTIPDLVRVLKPILNALSFDMVAGDSAAIRYQEEWHEQYTTELYSEAGSEAAAAVAAAPTMAAAGRPAATGRPAQAPNIRPPVGRPPRQAVPSSLQAILDGTHPSLRD
jgi:hypothetical protein